MDLFDDGDRVQFITTGTPWDREEFNNNPLLKQGDWGTVTKGDKVRVGKKLPSLVIVRWDNPDAPGLIARELLRHQYVIAEDEDFSEDIF